MTLQGIIIRADGVIAETDGLERSVLNQVIQSAGFNWTCTREAFAALRRHPRRRDRYRHFVRQNLGFDRSSEDFERLIEVMTRHSGTVARELIDKDYLDPRPGARELEKLDVDPATCLAIEATPHGAKTARAAGVPAVILLGHHEPSEDALFAIDELTNLIGRDDQRETAIVTPGDGIEILAALRRAHSGYFDVFGGLHRIRCEGR